MGFLPSPRGERGDRPRRSLRTIPMHLLESLQIAAGFLPVNLATAANTGDWVSLENYGRCAVVLYKDEGSGSEDPVITVQQATDAAGTGAQALNFTTVFKQTGADLLAIGQSTRVTQSAGNTFTAEGGEEALVVIDLRGDELDVANGYKFVRATVADVGVTSQLGALFYLLHEPRQADRPENMPSAIA